MRIAPINTNYYAPKFTSDLGDKLKERLSQGLSGLTNADGDEFVPVAPTQPIIVKEVKIYKNDSNAKETALGIGAGGAGVAGVSKLKKASNTNNNENQIDYDKITDESVQETRGKINDDSTEVTGDIEDDNNIETETLDEDDVYDED